MFGYDYRLFTLRSAIRKLLDFNRANPNVLIPRRGITPFHLAIGKGSEETAEEITKLFLVHGGNPNVWFVFFASSIFFASSVFFASCLYFFYLFFGNKSQGYLFSLR